MKKIILLGIIALSFVVQAGYLEEGNFYYQNRNYEKAEQLYLKAIQNGDKDFFTDLANMYAEEKKYDKAEQLYLKAIEKEVLEGYNNLGVLYLEQGKYDKAKNLFLIAINYETLKKAAAQNLFKLSLYYLNKRDLKNGLELMSIAAENGNLDAAQILAKTYYKMGEFDEAKKYFKIAANLGDKEAEENYLIAIETGNIEAMTNLGGIYIMQKKYEEAEKLLLKAVEGNDSFAYNNLGSLYLKQKKYDKAKNFFLKSIEMGNIEGPALNLGKRFLELKDYPNAKKYYKMAADLGNEEAQRIYREMLQNGY